MTSSGSAELIAVSSLFTYDGYKHYINPKATGAQLLVCSKAMILVYTVLMGEAFCPCCWFSHQGLACHNGACCVDTALFLGLNGKQGCSSQPGVRHHVPKAADKSGHICWGTCMSVEKCHNTLHHMLYPLLFKRASHHDRLHDLSLGFARDLHTAHGFVLLTSPCLLFAGVFAVILQQLDCSLGYVYVSPHSGYAFRIALTHCTILRCAMLGCCML